MSHALMANVQIDKNPTPITDHLPGQIASSPLASSLFQKRILGKAQPKVDRKAKSQNVDLIAEFLTYAAATEQKLAEQEERIAYLEALSHTDDLTKLANRRAFEIALEQALGHAKRFDQHGIIALFDLDGFKDINDQHGHEAGDLVLITIANLLASSVRSIDCAARLGGDEFAILLSPCKPLGGTRALQRLQHAIEQQSISYNGHSLTVGASLGLHVFDHKSTLRDLMFQADRAMYQNKRMRKQLANKNLCQAV
ncbi:hypothetical protein JCM17844_18550 [Iodidimonas gelatinilytica]|uniref:diguanylate cyclase n=1 Tax=Iodidimonas gelatinilytica TaxID=1236966 RepID=A0A5A7MT91_9PROT|nr:GGDEF domain-containing protein [Iodidimonas gelatinilytica]GEQ98218.1 hypothetical protein JCM17844_18550 [Iodidimonas gelatinilytica]